MDFVSFFREVHDAVPFPWQVHAAERLARRQRFRVTVPTGLGKSAMVDAALWASAQGAWRRIAFVVDRRIVVDAVHERALRIAAALEAPRRSPGMAALADRLGPMQVVRLRGGVFADDDWVLYPERLTVALTTVDQLGSRLLFRGYGVSPRRWPMHAGFFGRDTLVIVDEAHLSAPFLQTLDTLREMGARIDVLPMSATLGSAGAAAVQRTQERGHEGMQEGEQERAPGPVEVGLGDDDLQLPVVRQRLDAVKRAVLDQAGPPEADFVRVVTTHALELAAQPGVSRIGLIVNRVATARACFEHLAGKGVAAALLTGRVRAADRDRSLAVLLPQIAAGRERAAEEAPLFVVATQTVEVGADLDFDALVSECASLSALRQRFGRLDRLGQRAASAAVIVMRMARDRDDPVYGPALSDAWDWLQAAAADQEGTVDFGLNAMQATLAVRPAPPETVRHAATLLPAHIGLLAQTGPAAPQLEIAAWLHGPTERAPDVTVIWRDDLDAQDPSGWAAAVALLPPMLRESLPLPASAVRRWLMQDKPSDLWGDLESTRDETPADRGDGRAALRWRGPEDCAVVTAADIRPGDVLVVPSAWGGCDTWGWAPTSTAAVADLADECLAERIESGATRRAVVRLTPGRWASFGPQDNAVQRATQALLALQQQAATSEDDLEAELAAARQALIDSVALSPHPLAGRLGVPRIERHPCGLVLRGSGTEELEGVIETGRAVALDMHHADVGRWAAALCAGEAEAAAVVAAALIHDAGKAEARMQALLHGSPLAAAGGPVLAKSALRRRDEQLAAWRASGVPKGFRHEFASLDFAEVTDPLVRHLTATHHGFGRPWLPPCEDPAASGARFARLDAHWLQAWAQMLAARNPWQLAWLETLLRAADARASIEEAAGEA